MRFANLLGMYVKPCWRHFFGAGPRRDRLRVHACLSPAGRIWQPVWVWYEGDLDICSQHQYIQVKPLVGTKGALGRREF
jgi:hypothetical protein